MVINLRNVGFMLGVNGHVYETFGISKHLTVKLQLLLTRAETSDNSLTAKFFIYDVVCRYLFNHIIRNIII
jgi:hypothetical protein